MEPGQSQRCQDDLVEQGTEREMILYEDVFRPDNPRELHTGAEKRGVVTGINSRRWSSGVGNRKMLSSREPGKESENPRCVSGLTPVTDHVG